MTKRDQAASNKAALAALRGSELSVTVNGQTIELKRPSREQFIALNKHLMDNEEALQELQENKDLDAAMQELERIVMICVPGVETHEEAYDLIMLTGGSRAGGNELLTKCEVLCGIDRQAVEEAVKADPSAS